LVGAAGAGAAPVSNSSAFYDYRITGDILYPYVKSVQVFVCPSSQGGTSSLYSDHYSFNQRLCVDARSVAPVALASVASPASVIMCLDGGAYMCSDGCVTGPSGSFWYYPGTCQGRNPAGENSTYPLSGWRSQDYVGGRHHGGVNIAFADGHAKWVSGSTLYGNTSWFVP
jgi:prepilin-type processing-associated H-X9-DG protein